jgi:hypothetical protein
VALENWKDPDGAWNNTVVAVVAFCGLLLWAGLYYGFANEPDKAAIPGPPASQAWTTGNK